MLKKPFYLVYDGVRQERKEDAGEQFLLGPFLLLSLDVSWSCSHVKAPLSWTSKTVRLRGRQLLVAVGWNLSWSHGPEHPHSISSVFSLCLQGFLTEWLISLKVGVLRDSNGGCTTLSDLASEVTQLLPLQCVFTKELLKAVKGWGHIPCLLMEDINNCQTCLKLPWHLVSGI